MEKYKKTVGSFLRYQYLPHLAAAVVFQIGAGAILSFRNLDAQGAAKVMEMYACLCGIILLIPVFVPESDRAVWQLEQSKMTPMWKLYLGRVAVATLLVAVVAGIFILRLWAGGSLFSVWVLWRGTFCESLFLGAIGFFVCAVTNQVVLGYMVSVAYYVANIGAADRLGKFGLYPILRGDTSTWPWLLGAALLLLGAGIWLRERKR